MPVILEFRREKCCSNFLGYYKIALIDAKAKLSETIKIKIENETLKSSSSDGNSSFERQSTQTSNNMVRNAKVVEEYQDVDGGLYLWMVRK